MIYMLRSRCKFDKMSPRGVRVVSKRTGRYCPKSQVFVPSRGTSCFEVYIIKFDEKYGFSSPRGVRVVSLYERQLCGQFNVFVPSRGTSCFSKKVQKNSFAETTLIIVYQVHCINATYFSFLLQKELYFPVRTPCFFAKNPLIFC